MLAGHIRSYLVPFELADAPKNCYREILSEHNLWKFSGLFVGLSTITLTGTGACYWDMIYHWEGELSSQVLGCLQPVGLR